MRLFDADVMLKRLQEWNTNDPIDKAHYNFTLSRIIEQPTAYDVDKVVKELEKYQKLCFATMANTQDTQLDIVYEYVNSTIQEAIEIVRRGGANEQD